MLLISFFADAFFFFVNIYLITDDLTDNQKNKYNYFKKEDLKILEDIVDEVILELKHKKKSGNQDEKDKS